MKAVINIFLLCFLMLFFTDVWAENKPSSSPSLLINDVNWPPFFIPDSNSQLPGIAKELLTICLAKTGNNVEFKKLPIKRTHAFMNAGKLDIAVYSYKESREKFVIYGHEPIFSSNYGFAIKKGRSVTIHQLPDIEQYKFGHLAGLAHTPALLEIINRMKKNNQVVTGYELDRMLEQLITVPVRFDLMADSIETFLWRAKKLGISDKVEIIDFILKRKDYFITLSKKSTHIKAPEQLIQQLDGCLVNLKQTQDYQKMLARYGLN